MILLLPSSKPLFVIFQGNEYAFLHSSSEATIMSVPCKNLGESKLLPVSLPHPEVINLFPLIGDVVPMHAVLIVSLS